MGAQTISELKVISLFSDRDSRQAAREKLGDALVEMSLVTVEAVEAELARSPNAFVVVIGHREGGSLVHQTSDGTRVEFETGRLQARGRTAGITVVTLGCGSAEIAAVGAAREFNSIAGLDAVASGLGAGTHLEFFERIGASGLHLLLDPIAYDAVVPIEIVSRVGEGKVAEFSYPSPPDDDDELIAERDRLVARTWATTLSRRRLDPAGVDPRIIGEMLTDGPAYDESGGCGGCGGLALLVLVLGCAAAWLSHRNDPPVRLGLDQQTGQARSGRSPDHPAGPTPRRRWIVDRKGRVREDRAPRKA